MPENFLGILKNHNYEIFPTEKFSIDYREKEEYQDLGESFRENSILETDRSGKVREIKNIPYCGKSLFKYFLDGSRKVYKIAEINLNNKYLPLLCAQVGVACTCISSDLIGHFCL
jgi:hypothetical protein